MSSIVKVTCISALLTHDTETFSNMDPYVIIYCGNQKRKTRTHQEGGKRPQWNDSFSFPNPKSQQLKFVVWDEDTVTDDLVGQGTIDLTKFTQTPNVPAKEYISLTYQNRPAGKLYVEITYESSNQPNNMGGNNNNTAWNTNNNNWGGNNNGGNGWGNGNNHTNNNNWGNNNNTWGNTNSNQQQGLNTQNNTNGWNGQQNTTQQGWGSNNNFGGWGTQQNNTQVWGQTQPNQPNQSNQQNQPNQPGWNANNFGPNQNGGNNFGYQQPPNMEKKGSNNGVNPYGNPTTNDNSNPYPSLDDNKINPYPQNNSFELIIGAKLFGQQQQPPQPPQQIHTNAFNILDMAAKGAMQQNGWGQQPPQNQWNQPQQNQVWGQPNQPNNPWQNNNKPNAWGNGW